MNKIVLEHYPVEKLPDDVRRHFSRGASVTLKVEEEEPASPASMSKQELVAMLRAAQERSKGKGRTMDDIVAEIRELRDEWDD